MQEEVCIQVVFQTGDPKSYLVFKSSTVLDLKHEILRKDSEPRSVLDFALVFENTLLHDSDVIGPLVENKRGEAPMFLLVYFRPKDAAAPLPPKVVLLRFNNAFHEYITVATMGQLRLAAQEIVKHRGGIVVDLQLPNQQYESITHMDKDDAVPSSLVDVVVGGLLSCETPNNRFSLQVKYFQHQKDRLQRMNDMMFNSRVCHASLNHIGPFVSQHDPNALLESQQSLDTADALMKQVLERYLVMTPSVHSAVPISGADVETTTTSPLEQANVQPQQQQQPQQPPQERAGIRLAFQFDLGLLVKIGLMLAFLGHDAEKFDFYVMCLLGLLYYLASVGVLRVPDMLRNRLGQGAWIRIPPAHQEGFFLDVVSVLMSFFLSVHPGWKVIVRDEQEVPPPPGGDGGEQAAVIGAAGQ